MYSKSRRLCTGKRFSSKSVKYIHGIGINTSRLTLGEKKNDIRAELGLEKDDFIVLSIGELNENKNQRVIIQAIAMLRDSKIHYVLYGKGNQLENLKKVSSRETVKSKYPFLGYRKDVVDICRQADVYVMPSKREGLPVASLEAMYWASACNIEYTRIDRCNGKWMSGICMILKMFRIWRRNSKIKGIS